MSPDFNPGEIIIVDPELIPKPGQYIIVHNQINGDYVLRKYREKCSPTTGKLDVELIASNSDWPNLALSENDTVVGTLIEHRKQLIR